MKFVPLFDRVLVKPVTKSKANELGLVLTNISKERSDTGIVVCVGEGVDLDYKKCKMSVNVGDKILFNRYAGADVEIDGECYIVLRQIDIVGVFDERENNC